MVEADDESAKDVVTQAMSALDRAAKKGAIHANNASRRKSRLMKLLHRSQSSQSR